MSGAVQHVTPPIEDLSTVCVNLPCSASGCNRTFANSSTRRMHLEKVHRCFPIPRPASKDVCRWYHCPQEGCRYHELAADRVAKHFTKMANLKQHYLKVHAAPCLSCDSCGSGFSCQRLLLAHRRGCGLRLACQACPSAFTSLEALQSHCRRNGHQPDQPTMVGVRDRLDALAMETREQRSVDSRSLQQVCTEPTSQPTNFSLHLNSITVSDMDSNVKFSISDMDRNVKFAVSDIGTDMKFNVSDMVMSCSRTKPTDVASRNKNVSVGNGGRVDKCIGTMTFIMVNRSTNTVGGCCPSSSSTALAPYNGDVILGSDEGVCVTSRTRNLAATRKSVFECGKSVASNQKSHPPHLLAAIALSELAASAIKRGAGVDMGTQTDGGGGGGRRSPSRHVKKSSCPGRSEAAAAKRRRSAETQTRLTHKEQRQGVDTATIDSCLHKHDRDTATAADDLCICKKQRLDSAVADTDTSERLTQDPDMCLLTVNKCSVSVSSQDNTDGGVCVVHAFAGQQDLGAGNTADDHSITAEDNYATSTTADGYDGSVDVTTGAADSYFDVAPFVGFGGDTAELSASVCQSATQTSPRAFASVGRLTNQSLYGDLGLTLVNESTVQLKQESVQLKQEPVQLKQVSVQLNQEHVLQNPTSIQLNETSNFPCPDILCNKDYSPCALDASGDSGATITAAALPLAADSGDAFFTLSPGSGYRINEVSAATDYFSNSCGVDNNTGLQFSDDGSTLQISAANDDLHMSAANDDLHMSAANDDLHMSAANDGLQMSAANDGLQMSAANDGLQMSAANDGLQMSAANDGLQMSTSGLLLEEDSEVVFRDPTLSDISSDLVSSPHTKLLSSHSRRHAPKLSEIRSSSIETQTEHDVLLSLSASSRPSTSGSGPQSAWCSIETQTYEDFAEIERYLCSTSQTQTLDQMRGGELFPELSLADTHTQTGFEDSPYLVHSHTQTNS